MLCLLAGMLVGACTSFESTDHSAVAGVATRPATLRPEGAASAPATLTQALRGQMSLSGPGWKLWRDKTATWKEDTLYPPGTELAKIPATQPTGGWQALAAQADAIDVRVPATVEEYLWGAEGDPYGTAGNYQGVSFWWRTIDMPATWKGKRLVLHFGAARQRSEVYLNEKLVGYDIVGNTPFRADITDAVRWDGKPNVLAVRITDPNDNNVSLNFDWADYAMTPWDRPGTGKGTPASKGFGGITDDVTLVATDPIAVTDVYVKNKPSPSATRPTDIDVEVTLQNRGDTQRADVVLRIVPAFAESPEPVKTVALGEVEVKPGLNVVKGSVSMPEAKIWSLEEPHLYYCEAVATVKDKPWRDANRVRFGFRWFGMEGIGDPTAASQPATPPQAKFTLNGKRMVVRSAITWSYYPVNGMIPTEELVERQILAARQLGLNMLFMHRNIAPRMVVEKAEEMGLLLYCEPGGYKAENAGDDAKLMAREKLLRMVERDRSSPAVAVWGMINEIWVRKHVIEPRFLTEMAEAHKLDETRAIVLASGQAVNTRRQPMMEGKSWMMPYDHKRREHGWTDEHRASGPGTYHDGLYRGPEAFYCMEGPEDEIIFWGEDGAISTPPQLDALMTDYKKWGRMGWDGDDYTRWHKGYSEWLDAHNARQAFPTVDDLCRSLGNVAYYYQGRIIENVRMNNKTDGYVINAWDCQKLDNHSGIIDIARRFKGDPELIARYAAEPLYVAVKLRNKFAKPGGETVADFWIVNEADVKGPHTLVIRVKDGAGKEISRQTHAVNIAGGETYGELLVRDIALATGDVEGYARVEAELLPGKAAGDKDEPVARGDDNVLIVDYKNVKLPAGGVVMDRRGNVETFLTDDVKAELGSLEEGKRVPYIIATHNPTTHATTESILQRVEKDGTTLIALVHADKWATILANKKVITFEGVVHIRGGWVGGGLFALESPILAGLPQKQGLNWEYQYLQTIRARHDSVSRSALLLGGDEAVIGAFNHHEPRLATSLGVIKHGKGRIILSTLDIPGHLSNPEPPAAVVKRLLVNMISTAK